MVNEEINVISGDYLSILWSRKSRKTTRHSKIKVQYNVYGTLLPFEIQESNENNFLKAREARKAIKENKHQVKQIIVVK